MTGPNIVDSSGWLEYLLNTDRADLFAPAIEDPEHLIVPIITVYEVYKKTLRDLGESSATQTLLAMQTGRIIPLDIPLALAAARQPLALADSLIYSTAIAHNATLWTQDHHFQNLPQVRYFPKPPAPTPPPTNPLPSP